MNEARLTYSIISKPMTREKAKQDYDYAQRCMPQEDNFSAVRSTLEVWDGAKWVIVESFAHENR